MAETIRTYVSDGVQVLYPVDFVNGFIDREHIFVYLTENAYTTQIAYTFISDSQIQLTNPVALDGVFHIRRVVPRDKVINNYTDGAVLKEKNLNDSYKQTIMILEETGDGYIIPLKRVTAAVRAAVDDGSLNFENTELADVQTRGGKIFGFNPDGTFSYTHGAIALGVNNDTTLTGMINDSEAIVGQSVYRISDRENAIFTTVLTSSVTPLPSGSTQGADIIASVFNPLISFVLRVGREANAKHFGAAGDDTADDTAAIQAAVDYCASTERSEGFPTINPVRTNPFFPAGIFKITKSIIVTSYLTISGIGRIAATIKNYMTDGSKAFVVSQPVDTESQNYNIFKDFTIHGNGKFSGPSDSGGIDLRYTNRYKLSSMHITQTTREAISIFRSDIGMLLDCIIWNCGDTTRAAVLLDGTGLNFGSNACSIIGGEIVSSGSIGLHIAQGVRTSVTHTAFQAHATAEAIVVTSGQAITIDSVYFELNKGNVKILSGISVKVINCLHGSPVVGYNADIVVNRATNCIFSGNEHLVGSTAIGETTEIGALLFDGSYIGMNFGTNPYPVSAGILALIEASSSSGAVMDRWEASTNGLSTHGKRWFKQDVRLAGELYKNSETVARLRNLIGLTTTGNSNATLITGTATEVQVWGSAITGDRLVTLDTTFSKAGDSYTIVRAVTATGAFDLNVGDGLKALAAGEWCIVYYDGTAWVLIGFGSL